MTTVMAFGTFDLLHPGHKYFLKQAKKQGENLIVIIARDLTVKKIKGELPYHHEKERQRGVSGLNLANQVILGSLTDKYAAIKKYRPDIIALGYDQKFFIDQLGDELKKIKLNTKVIRLKAFRPEEHKTSIIKMENNLIKIFDFLTTAGFLKKTLRYKSSHKVPKESVADHSWRLALMSFIIAEELKLKLNIAQAMEIALIHDLAEAITDDIDAILVHKKIVTKEEKKGLEEAAMKKLKAMLPNETGNKFINLWREYIGQSTAEAKYIYALDKLEALTYLTETGHETYDDIDFIPGYADQAVDNFKKLKPVLKILKDKIRKEYRKGNLAWKKEYDKV